MSNNQLSDTFLSDAHLADYAAIEPMYVDGVAGVFNLGANFGTMSFGGLRSAARAARSCSKDRQASFSCSPARRCFAGRAVA